jgi:hypothetical protein
MIYCNLKGGLGNMLFQIAATKAYAIDAGVDVSFPNLNAQMKLINDDNFYNPSIKHSFEYEAIFKDLIRESPTNPKLVKFPFEYIKHNVLDNSIIDGFFQSEKYFNRHRDEILKLLEIPETIKDTINEKYGNVLSSKTTSLHVRRGDYVRHPNHHPTQSIEYYNKAMDLLQAITETFVVFSDDIAWCKEHLNYDNVIYIENEKDYIEVYLMSLCDNNIIANSSFSWWGAWLNQNNDKIVVGPKKWFGSAINHDTSDIIPDSWIKI